MPPRVPVRTPMFARGQVAHHRRIFSGSVVALFRPCSVQGCLPASLHFAPFEQSQRKNVPSISKTGLWSGKTGRPIAA